MSANGFSRRAQLALLLAAEDWTAAAALLSNSSATLAADLTPEQARHVAAVPAPPVDRGLAVGSAGAVPGLSVNLVKPTGKIRRRAA